MIGLPMRDRNRRLIAQRLGWPDGAAQACERLEAQYPAWDVTWRPYDPRPKWGQAEGYYANLAGQDPLHHGRRRRELYADDPEGLARRLG